MKTLFWIIIIVVLTFLLGTWVLSLLGWLFDILGTVFKSIAGFLDFFGWNGLI